MRSSINNEQLALIDQDTKSLLVAGDEETCRRILGEVNQLLGLLSGEGQEHGSLYDTPEKAEKVE